MRKRSKRTGISNRIFGAVTAVALLAGSAGFTSMAAETDPPAAVAEEDGEVEILEAHLIENLGEPSGIMPYTMLADCDINVTGGDDGMHIAISTGAVGMASVLGVKDVKIWKKNWLGMWKEVANAEGSEAYNRSIMAISITYGNAERGATYKITCVHYGNVDGYTEWANDSGEFVFNF